MVVGPNQGESRKNVALTIWLAVVGGVACARAVRMQYCTDKYTGVVKSEKKKLATHFLKRNDMCTDVVIFYQI